MIRVLSVLHGNTFGGPHNRNLRIAPILRDRYDTQVAVLMPREPGNAPARLRAAGLEVIEVPIPRLRKKLDPRFHARFISGFGKAVGAIRGVIRQHEIDIVQINGISNPHAAIAARKEGVPVVWQILDTFPPPWFLRIMMPYVVRTAAAIMSTGERVAAGHPGASSLGERLVYFHPPVDLATFTWRAEAASAARQALGLAPEIPVIGNVSNLNPQKGHVTFIQAAARLKGDLPNARFVILGRTYDAHRAYLDGLLAEAASLGLRLDEDLIIRDPQNRVAELSSAFDVFVMTPRPRSEGIPTVIEEAMALARPVVAADVGSIGEIVQDGQTGFLVQPGDAEGIRGAVLEILRDDALRDAMGRRARAFAERHFGVDTCARRHAQAYALALGRRLADAES
jgi:glycosyltransferase involved in cell wall biosynthesis